jgi:hypothetical protein
MVAQPKSETLRALYWREEILQVMFWLKGEGLGGRASQPMLERFLGEEAPMVTPYLDRLVAEGFLATEGGWFVLTAKGLEEGESIYSEEFANLARPDRGECGPVCWCRASTEEAEACLAQRTCH